MKTKKHLFPRKSTTHQAQSEKNQASSPPGAALDFFLLVVRERLQTGYSGNKKILVKIILPTLSVRKQDVHFTTVINNFLVSVHLAFEFFFCHKRHVIILCVEFLGSYLCESTRTATYSTANIAIYVTCLCHFSTFVPCASHNPQE